MPQTQDENQRDQQWMARLAKGDEEALEALIACYRIPAERYAREMLRDDALAQDAVQETFARIYLARERYLSDFTFRTYLYTLLRRVCIDMLRRGKHIPLPMEELPENLTRSAETSVEQEVLRQEHRQSVLEEVANLPLLEQRLLLGYALEGKKYRQLARENGLTPGQVKIRLHRLRQRLKKRLAEKEGDL